MTNLVAARWQMGLSLAFHIVFAVIGMAMPVMMAVAESLWLRISFGAISRTRWLRRRGQS